MAFGIPAQQTSGCGKRPVMMDAAEYIQNLPLKWPRVRDAVGGKQWQLQLPRNGHSRVVSRLLFAAIMALQFDIHILLAEYPAQLLNAFHRAFHAAAHQGVRQGTFLSSGQAYEPAISGC